MIDYTLIKSKANRKGVIVMIPGFAHTKQHYLETPDKRAGWAYNFSELGYDVYAINWPGIKNNFPFKNNEIDSENIISGISNFIKDEIKEKVILLTHSAAGIFGWKLAELLPEVRTVVGIAPGGPGNIQPIPDIKQISNSEVEVIYNTIPYRFDFNKSWEPTDFWIHNKLIGASKFFPTENYKEYKESLISVPSKVLYERMNINGSQIKIDKNKIKEYGTKIFIFTGTEDIDHSKDTDNSINDWFLKNSIKSEFHWLGDEGFVGNGHMIMLEKNSMKIAEHISKIIETS